MYPHKNQFYVQLNKKRTTTPKSVLVTTKCTYNNKTPNNYKPDKRTIVIG
jgi:hypothetical protein